MFTHSYTFLNRPGFAEFYLENSPVRYLGRHGSLRSWLSCPLLVHFDLAEAYFITVNCTTKLVAHLACTIAKKIHGNNLSVAVSPNFCGITSLLYNSNCFHFHWQNASVPCVSNYEQSDQLLPIFDAVQATKSPPIIRQDHIVFTIRYHNKRKMSLQIKASPSHGFCINKHNTTQVSNIGENVFNCSQEFQTILPIYFHIRHLQNGQTLCFAKNLQQICTMQNAEVISKRCTHFLQVSGRKQCSPLLKQFLNGNCEIYTLTKPNNRSTTTRSRQHFTCQSNSYQNNSYQIDIAFVDDLVQDCKPDGQDETILLSLQRQLAYHLCDHPHQIPCLDGHSQCFNISEICQYKLNSLGFLYPCRNGEHMQNCSTFVCDKMFKCGRSFCIPWDYTCDGKWDCIDGLDESEAHQCATDRKCVYLFKCVGTQICVHLENICDKNTHCPQGDDEDLCDLKDVFCPDGCSCVTYALFCTQIVLHHLSSNAFQPFFVVFFVNTTFDYVSISLDHLVILHISHSSLANTDIYSLLSCASRLKYASLIETGISVVERMCVSEAKELVFLDMTNNQITGIRNQTFSFFENLKHINLSSNPIQVIFKDAFGSLPNLNTLSLLHIFQVKIPHNLFSNLNFKILEASTNYMCCFMPEGASCSLNITEFVSCGTLLKQTSLRFTCAAAAFSILFVNIATILLQKIPSDRNTKIFDITVILVGVSEITSAVAFFLLWIWDLLYGVSFPMFRDIWQRSTPCFLAFGMFLNHKISGVIISSFVAFARLMVIKHPMDTPLKRTGFFKKQAIKCMVMSLFLSGLLTFFTWFLDILLLEHGSLADLCSPMYDHTKVMIMAKVIVWCITITQCLSICCVMLMYTDLFRSLKKCQEFPTQMRSLDNTIYSLATQLVVFTCSNILCWVVPNMIYFTSMFLTNDPLLLIYWATLALGSINSLTNPCVYFVLSIRQRMKTSGKHLEQPLAKKKQSSDDVAHVDSFDSLKHSG